MDPLEYFGSVPSNWGTGKPTVNTFWPMEQSYLLHLKKRGRGLREFEKREVIRGVEAFNNCPCLLASCADDIDGSRVGHNMIRGHEGDCVPYCEPGAEADRWIWRRVLRWMIGLSWRRVL
jgi:hypothetical protein